jgi:hypothetical protein
MYSVRLNCMMQEIKINSIDVGVDVGRCLPFEVKPPWHKSCVNKAKAFIRL